jgi:hypothetical protein
LAVLASQQNATTVARATTPAKAGVQLGNAQLAGAALYYLDFPNWAPAFAGVVFMNRQHA